MQSSVRLEFEIERRCRTFECLGEWSHAVRSWCIVLGCTSYAHIFDCRLVFAALYEPVFRQASEARVLALRETNDVILRSGLVDMVEAHLRRYFEQLAGGGTAADVHRSHLARLQGWWHGVQSSSTCLCCLRRRPQYGLPCGHSFCENCVVVFRDNSGGDPWVFTVRRCFLCGQASPTDMVVRVHPPTARAASCRWC
ncbi:hypothetical protein BS50DRAFT_316976 [Corynespora cassiicola Philippines]|uniref:RING-type domain-containing protein n=1 Tax=Corynespora cassiicola Philippines TaxID=1448308 RepID=A0A2T2N0Y6_CORCC|nr:hypothetical protein BS50DRAFT_316976 [Corynespora cassiicola Philippines]